jgi:heptosyltransferase-1
VTSVSFASPPESLLIVRLGAMGDVIHTLYAVSALRAVFPELRMGWAIEEAWSELLCAQGTDRCGPRSPWRPVVNCVHPLNTKSWRRSLTARGTWKEMSSAFGAIRSQHYQLAADFQGAMKSAIITRSARAQLTVGMEDPRERQARLFYQQRVLTKGTHVIEQYQLLAQATGGKGLPSMRPEFPHDHQAEAKIAAELGNGPGNLVILNPGAGWAAKQWPADRYGLVAKALAADGMKPIINFSSAEHGVALQVAASSDGTALPMASTIGELIALTRRARLFIGGDTGPMHLAAALGVPVVAIFGPTDPARNGPHGTKSVVLRNPASRTSLSHTSRPDPGLEQISAGEVIGAARHLLESCYG